MPGETDHSRAAVFRSPERRESRAAIADNRRHRGKSLDIAEQRGRLPGAHYGRERRLHARDAAFAFDGIEQRRLFAAFVCACAGVRIKIEIETGALDVLAQVAARVGFADGAVHVIDQVAIFAANVDVAFVRVHRAAGDQDAFDQLMRIVFHQQPILAGARLALVGIDDDVLRLGRRARHEAPFHAGGKSRAAAAAQSRDFDLFDDLLGSHLHGLEKGFEAVVGEIGIERSGVGEAKATGQDFDFERAGFVIEH